MTKIRFGDVELDLAGVQLERDGAVVPVEPQVFEVLAHLVENRDRMVPKTELLDEIWGDRFVSESALTSRIKSARAAIGDNGRDQRLIRTVHGRGYRFVGDVVGTEASPSWDPDRAPRDGDGTLVAELLTSLQRGVGPAVAVVSGSAPGRAGRVDDLVGDLVTAGLLAGRGESGGLRAFGGILDTLEQWARRRPELLDDLPAACRVELSQLFDGGSPVARQRLFMAVAELVAAAGRSGGAVVAVEDVHLMDGPSLDLLAHLVRAARRAPVVVVVSHRPGFPLGDGFRVVEHPGGEEPIQEHLPAELRGYLAPLAVLGDSFTRDEVEAVCDLDPVAARSLVHQGRASGVLVEVGPEGESAGPAHGTVLAFTDDAGRRELESEVPPGRRRELLVAAATALEQAGRPPGDIAARHLAAGDVDAAAPYLRTAASAAAALQLHSEVVSLTERVDEVADPSLRLDLLELRADALTASGDLEGIRRFREALTLSPPDRVPWLRARLGRACIFAGDLDSAQDALEGLEPNGSASDGPVLLVLATLDYFLGDLESSELRLEEARRLALVPGAPAQMLDSIALQGMIAHSKGEWFERLRRELRVAATSPELVGTVFDSHVCVAQYLLYGPTTHAEVIDLAADLRDAAEQHGSARAVGFATVLGGEARFLSGDLTGAREALEEAVELHRRLGAEAGESHALQRLAEVALAEGDRAQAERLARRALPLARWSSLSQHLMQRTYGTLIAAAPDPVSALAVVQEARETLDDRTSCEFCQVTVEVPAAIACATAGRIEEAEDHLEAAALCASRWEGPAWPAAVREAEGVLAVALGERDRAVKCFRGAAAGFAAAGQVLDEERCREALVDLEVSA